MTSPGFISGGGGSLKTFKFDTRNQEKQWNNTLTCNQIQQMLQKTKSLWKAFIGLKKFLQSKASNILFYGKYHKCQQNQFASEAVFETILKNVPQFWEMYHKYDF